MSESLVAKDTSSLISCYPTRCAGEPPRPLYARERRGGLTPRAPPVPACSTHAPWPPASAPAPACAPTCCTQAPSARPPPAHLRVALGPQRARLQQRLAKVHAPAVHVQPRIHIVQRVHDLRRPRAAGTLRSHAAFTVCGVHMQPHCPAAFTICGRSAACDMRHAATLPSCAGTAGGQGRDGTHRHANRTRTPAHVCTAVRSARVGVRWKVSQRQTSSSGRPRAASGQRRTCLDLNHTWSPRSCVH